MKDMYTKIMPVIRDFYFSGLYHNDKIKAQIMPGNVRRDFEPFSDFLQRSIKAKENAGAVGASFRIPEKDISLVLCDAVVKIHTKDSASFEIHKPSKNMYLLDFEDEFDGEIDEIRIGKNNVIWKKGQYEQNYEGKIFIDLQEENYMEIADEQKVKVWLENGEDINTVLKRVRYNELGTYRIDTDNDCKIESIKEKGDMLKISYPGECPKEVTLFDEKFTVKNNNASKNFCDLKIDATKNGSPVDTKILNQNEKIIVLKNISENDVMSCRIKIDDVEEKFEPLTNEEILKIISSTKIKYLGGVFCCSENEFENYQTEAPYITFKKMKKQKQNDKRRLKNDEKIVGTVIELIEDDDFKNDVYSNTDMFFAETTIRLTDDPDSKNKKRNEYEIGWQDASKNLMEIALVDKKKLTRIDINALPEKLYIVSDISQLIKQKQALNKLIYQPMPAHKPLLELTERWDDAEWEKVDVAEINKWYRLTDVSREGCYEQREFVKRAICTPDFAFLDGPPGSGKTTTILEIIAQAVMAGKKVMLSASTNAAVDNILERLCDLPEDVQNKILAVRIGRKDAISEKVDAYNIHNISDEQIKNEVIKRANLVCSTIFGILQHPSFDLKNETQPAIPLYDYLIVDEASKTTFQDFIVPALYAKRWILSGDLRQLTPYTEQDSLVNALRANPHFSEAHQYVQSLLVFLRKEKGILNKARFCIPVSKNIAGAAIDLKDEFSELKIAVLTKDNPTNKNGCVTEKQFLNGENNSVYVWGCKVLFVEEDIFNSCEKFLPRDFITILSTKDFSYSDAKNSVFYKNQKLTVNRHDCKNCDELRDKFSEQMKEHTWANEIVWRLCRIQELFQEQEGGEKNQNLEKEIKKYIPKFSEEKIEEEIAMIKSLALPSVLQLLQKGVAEEVVKNRKTTALNQGFPENKFDDRYMVLEYQHRMHPEISKFSAENIYNGKALKNPKWMEEIREWDCDLWNSRNIWLDIKASGNCKSENRDEAEKIKTEISRFMNWAEKNPNVKDKIWSVAVLTYYRGQERKLKQCIKTLFGEQRERSYYKYENKNVEVKIFTVDKFQGQEADVVFISLVKSAKNNANDVPLGFMDSPNRLNVALTRAKYQRVIVGNSRYFKENRCSTELLKKLTESCDKVSTK